MHPFFGENSTVMANRNLVRTFRAPEKITVINLDNNCEVQCAVIDYGKLRITVAVNGIKIVLTKNSKGVFEGKLAGMSLQYQNN